MVASLKKNNIRGRVLEFSITEGPMLIGARVGDEVIQISTTGIHKAVHVDGLVFDNIFKSGIPLDAWKAAMEISPVAKSALKVTKF